MSRADNDQDGTGNNGDADDDNDGYADITEANSGTDPLDGVHFPGSGGELSFDKVVGIVTGGQNEAAVVVRRWNGSTRSSLG